MMFVSRWILMRKLKKWDNYLCFVKGLKISDELPLKIGREPASIADPARLFTHIGRYELLLNEYPLKKTATGESDLKRVLNVLDWFCENTLYSGAQTKHLPDDSVKILAFSYKKPFLNAINCRDKAIVFSDCLLALGIRSFPVCLLSKGECHFMSQVYLGELGKWGVFDPSFHTYFTDDRGIALSVFELRTLLCEGRWPCVHGYTFNGTDECQEVYIHMFVKQCLSNITTWEDNSDDRRKSGIRKKRKKFETGVPEDFR